MYLERLRYNDIERHGLKTRCSDASYCDRYRGVLVVLGCGDTLWDDWERVKWTGASTMAINEVGMLFPGKLTHWVSLHSNLLGAWARVRYEYVETTKRLADPFDRAVPVLHGRNPDTQIDVAWQLLDGPLRNAIAETAEENSALFGAVLGIMMGYDRILLCGCPASGWHLIFKQSLSWYDEQRQRELLGSMIAEYPILRDRVRSASGLTRSVFGDIDHPVEV